MARIIIKLNAEVTTYNVDVIFPQDCLTMFVVCVSLILCIFNVCCNTSSTEVHGNCVKLVLSH